MPLSALLEAAAADEVEGNSDTSTTQSQQPGPEALAGAAGSTEVAGTGGQNPIGVGAGCLLLRLREDSGCTSLPTPRPETCVVGWLGLGGAEPTVMLFCAANDLSILRELY